MMFYDLIPKPREQDPKAGRQDAKNRPERVLAQKNFACWEWSASHSFHSLEGLEWHLSIRDIDSLFRSIGCLVLRQPLSCKYLMD